MENAGTIFGKSRKRRRQASPGSDGHARDQPAKRRYTQSAFRTSYDRRTQSPPIARIRDRLRRHHSEREPPDSRGFRSRSKSRQISQTRQREPGFVSQRNEPEVEIDTRRYMGQTSGRTQPLSFRRMEQILNLPINGTALELCSEIEAFRTLLDETSFCKKPEWLFLILQCLIKCFNSSRNASAIEILQYTCDSAFFSHVQKYLCSYALGNRLGNVHLSSMEVTLLNITEILLECLTRIPTVLETLMPFIDSLGINVHRIFEKDRSINQTKVNQKMKQLSHLQEQLIKQNKPNEASTPLKNTSFNLLPPLSEYPMEGNIDLRPLQSKYDNVTEFIYTLFHLFRGDFVLPLCKGLSDYRKFKEGTQIEPLHSDHIYLYQNVKFVKFSFKTKEGLVCLFDFSRARKMFSNDKNFKYGSLLCLSSDEFENELIYAEVFDTEKMSDGVIGLHFVDLPMISHLWNQTFDVFESSAFYGSYMPVLKTLREMYVKVTDIIHGPTEQIPFTDYILHGDNGTKPPSYIRDVAFPKADFSSILNGVLSRSNPVRKKYRSVNLWNPSEWPPKEIIGLGSDKKEGIDDAQYNALKAAITSEFCLIQGPPGTGKTYIGLLVMKFLLANQALWRTSKQKGPILLVCYTNHALDQFLEGVKKLHSFRDDSDLIRVGSRSKSKTLKVHNLNDVRWTFRERKSTKKSRARLKSTCKEASELSTLLTSASDGVIHEESLKEMGCVSSQHYEDLMKHIPDQHIREIGEAHPTDSAMITFLDLNIRDKCQRSTRERMQTNEEVMEQHDHTLSVCDEDDSHMSEMRKLQLDDSASESEDGYADDLVLNLRLLRGGQSSDRDGENVNDSSFWLNMSDEEKGQLASYVSAELENPEKLTQDEVAALERNQSDIWCLSPNHRWKLYRFWRDNYISALQKKLGGLLVEYEQKTKAYQEALNAETERVLSNALVVGMTTTGAARFSSVLKEVAPPIMIVEEAAEILEPHVVAALNNTCKHLVQIGDHKQLRPKPNSYRLAVDYKLDVSLFERLVRGGMKCHSLQTQHRMRPEICSLLKPVIYKTLDNHPSVSNLPPVKGIGHNMYFVNHNVHEEEDSRIKSHTNTHEAHFMARLCRYILQQGAYREKDITILCTYLGQAKLLRKLLPRSGCSEDVIVSTVDNYQGEENKIILLSLVRSNKDGRIGFLKESNRVCVALSRAQEGLYVMGNLGQLASGSSIWNEIVIHAEAEGIIGSCLKLRCQNHPDRVTRVRNERDFDHAPEGGCSRNCGARLEQCGHQCRRCCHADDPQHRRYLCRVPCNKLCINGHKCRGACRECKGGKTCVPCPEQVTKRIPGCQHLQKVSCHVNPDKFECQEKCRKLLPCGHQCTNRCGERCAVICSRDIVVKLACDHSNTLKCGESERHSCQEKCGSTLPCGHLCTGTCGSCLRGRLHVACAEACHRTLVCGHVCREPCVRTCPPCSLPCPQRCWHNSCRRTCGEPCVACTEQCQWKCSHFQCGKKCGEPCDRPPCDRRCHKTFERCGHLCIGVCGEVCPKLCMECDSKDIGDILDMYSLCDDKKTPTFMELECGHTFETQWLDRYMNTFLDYECANTDDNDTDHSRVSIRPAVCPMCREPINMCGRYGNILKEIQSMMDKVKQTLHRGFEDKRDLQKEYVEETRTKCLQEKESDYLLSRVDRIRTRAEYTKENCVMESLHILNCMVSGMQEEKRKLDEHKTLQTFYSKLLSQVRHTRQWIVQQRGWTENMFSQLQHEINLFQTGDKMIQCGIIIQGFNGCGTETERVITFLDVLTDMTPVPTSQINKATAFIKQYEAYIDQKAMYEESIEMAQVVNFSSGGQWYECKNGHVYVITECGGAVEEGKCPECQEVIGGKDHKLRGDNRRVRKEGITIYKRSSHPAHEQV